jgi:hypothetical protein
VWGVLISLLMPGLLLGALSGLLPEDAAGISLMLGFGALMIGLAMAARVFRQALAADDV